MPLILASRSPRRAELLRQIGLDFVVSVPDVDESRFPGEPPADYVVRLAREKAAAVAVAGAVSLGADTAVVLDHRVLGKPAGADEGVAMLLALSDRTHRVMTGVAACGDGRLEGLCVTTEVRFRAIDRAEAEAYWRTGEGADKAGGYGIQGIGGIFVEALLGSYSAVVGLPLWETERLLRSFGVNTWRERMHE
jgi:septum formation protein